MNVMWLGENECVWWIKWKLWLMVSCGFLEKGEKDYRTGNGNSTGSKRDLAVNGECKKDILQIEF